jgi:hypothetical protein
MANNFLEQLVAEWYELQGFFVRRNVLVGSRARGGYESELDVVAFHPGRGEVVHIEPSMDSSKWDERERRYANKFAAGRKYIPSLFHGVSDKHTIRQIAILVYGGRGNRRTLGGGELIFADALFVEIMNDVKTRSIHKAMVPEQYPLLRTLQFVAEYRTVIVDALRER